MSEPSLKPPSIARKLVLLWAVDFTLILALIATFTPLFTLGFERQQALAFMTAGMILGMIQLILVWPLNYELGGWRFVPFCMLATALYMIPEVGCCLFALTPFAAIPYWILSLSLELELHRANREPLLYDQASFTLRTLFLITTLTGAVLGVARLSAYLLNSANSQDGSTLVVIFWIIMWYSTSFAFPLGLLPPRMFPNALYLLALCIYLAVLPAWIGPFQDVAPLVLGIVTFEAFLAGNMLVLRGFGYRLVKKRIIHPPISTSSEVPRFGSIGVER